MPTELDEIEDMDTSSSAVSELDEAVETGQPEVTAAAISSPATDETEVDTLSVVRDVVEQREETTEAASSAEGEETGEAAGGQSELDNDGYTDAPFHKHPRFQDLIREKNSYREDAVRYRNVQSFIDQNGLSAEEVAEGMTIMALIKSDPQKAWSQLKPIVQNVLVAAGEVLPDDIKQRVEKGELTRDVGLELSRNRAAEQTRAAREQFFHERGTRQQQIEHSTSLISSAETWLNDRRLKDPNFPAKEPRLQREIAFLHSTEGKPKDVAGVQAQLKRAYEAVNKDFVPAVRRAAPTPPRKAVRPVTGGTVAGNVRPAVNSTVDLIKNIVSASRQSA